MIVKPGNHIALQRLQLKASRHSSYNGLVDGFMLSLLREFISTTGLFHGENDFLSHIVQRRLIASLNSYLCLFVIERTHAFAIQSLEI